MNNSKTWIIVPTYNEEKVIFEVIHNLRKFFLNVIVIDDSSTDETAKLAFKAGAIVLSHPINLGQGASIQTGLNYAINKGGEIFVTYDGDGQHQVDDVTNMINQLTHEEPMIICGSRFLGIDPIGLKVSKKIILKLAVLFTRIISNLKVTDAHNGLRVINRLAALKINIKQNRMAHATEIISIIKENNIQYKEFPVKIIYSNYSVAKGQKISNSLNILVDLFFGGFTK
jgi:glycosyltransferase involved in cell wall biosynthesis